MKAMGTARETSEGKMRADMVFRVPMLPLIHSMVVVTSPMGRGGSTFCLLGATLAPVVELSLVTKQMTRAH